MSQARVPLEMQRKIARNLIAIGKRRRGELQSVAQAHGVSARTVQNWIRREESKEGTPRWGCPPSSDQEKWRALLRVCRVLREHGYDLGRDAVQGHLGDAVRPSLVRWALGQLKARKRKRRKSKRLLHRVGVSLFTKAAVLAQDATHLGRQGDGQALEAEVVRCPATHRVQGALAGLKAGATDIIEFLKGIELPLIFQSDNGSAYIAQEVEDFLREHQVVHLMSRPRRPTDNPVIERGMRELKGHTGLGKGLRGLVLDGVQHLLDAWSPWVNSQHRRACRGGATADELWDVMPHWSTRVSRSEFYESTTEKLKSAREAASNFYARRTAEREVIFNQLARYGLASITRGGVPVDGQKW